jgi:hypothetical protein
MIGEDLLVNDFEAAEQDAKMQLQKVIALMEKDQR